MTKRTRRLLYIVVGLLVALVVTLSSLYVAVRHVPAFYSKAMQGDPEKQDTASKRLLQQAAALSTAFKKDGAWEALVTADEINGWFAVDAIKSHAEAMPRQFRNPRVSIDSKYLTLACLFETEDCSSVVSLTIEPYMPEPNVLALRFIKARAGLLPVPLRSVSDRLTKTAHELQLHLEWRQSHGDPVALLSLPDDHQESKHHAVIETLRLGEGEIYFAGVTKKGKGAKPAPSTDASTVQAAVKELSKEASPDSTDSNHLDAPKSSPTKNDSDLDKTTNENTALPPIDKEKPSEEKPLNKTNLDKTPPRRQDDAIKQDDEQDGDSLGTDGGKPSPSGNDSPDSGNATN
jgi:hypothetical protein